MCGQLVGLVLTLGLLVRGDTWTPNQGTPASPCPGAFQYQVEPGGIWYGLITVPTIAPDFNIKLTVEMGIDAILPNQYAGKIELVEHKNEVWRRLITGDKQPIQYRLYFPVSWPLPVVKRIALNQNVICHVNSQPSITKLSLEHILYPIRLNGAEANKPVYMEQSQADLIPVVPPHPQTSHQIIHSKPVAEYLLPGGLREPAKPMQPLTTPSPYITPPPRTQRPTTTTTTTTQAPTLATGEECGVSVAGAVPLIVNGQPTAKGEWPWLVAMFTKSRLAGLQFQCGGSLLSQTVVLTAAHCVKYRGRPEVKADAIVLYLGKHNLQQWTEAKSQARDVERVHLHPEYNSEDGRYDADLAIMVMSEAVEYTLYIRPICLWIFAAHITQIVGQKGTVVGWGKDETGTISSEPHQVTMPIVSQGDCVLSNKEFAYYVTNRTFCAGNKDGKGPCSGDSGGGFMIGYHEGEALRWYLRGVVHLSLLDRQSQQCDLRSYLIYTDVALYMDWVREFVPY